MSPTPSRWFSYGEPTGNGRVEAEIRTTYESGPNEQRDDDVREGTVAFEALEVLEESEAVQEHRHDDGSVLLSALPHDVEDELLETFEPVAEVEN